MGGVMTLAGEPADPPNMIYGNQGNISASINAAQGTLVALLHAESTGQGQHVDVSAQESLSMSQETAMQTWDLQKRNRIRTGERGAIPIALPATGIYECKDGYVSLFVLAPAGEDTPSLIDWMRDCGMAEDLDEEPYASLIPQLNMAWITQVMGNIELATQHVPALAHIHAVMQRFFLSLGAKEAYEEGQTRRLLVGLVSTPKDLGENTQLRARGWFPEVEFDYLGRSIEFPGGPYRLSETPVQIGRPPRLGEHTAEVLASLG